MHVYTQLHFANPLAPLLHVTWRHVTAPQTHRDIHSGLKRPSRKVGGGITAWLTGPGSRWDLGPGLELRAHLRVVGKCVFVFIDLPWN